MRTPCPCFRKQARAVPVGQGSARFLAIRNLVHRPNPAWQYVPPRLLSGGQSQCYNDHLSRVVVLRPGHMRRRRRPSHGDIAWAGPRGGAPALPPSRPPVWLPACPRTSCWRAGWHVQLSSVSASAAGRQTHSVCVPVWHSTAQHSTRGGTAQHFQLSTQTRGGTTQTRGVARLG